MDLSHLDKKGAARMVDVSGKESNLRKATAEGYVVTGKKIIDLLADGTSPKGNVYETARLAGIMATKKTGELIPLCHPLPISHVSVDFEPGEDRIRIISSVSTVSPTGVEMEALTAVNVAALTLYDMLKSQSKSMRIESIRLLEKTGGKSGTYKAD